ncbi:MAG TPA: hypothetical protein VK171_02420 [Fimbriimonas sp.]|nr:hypothetical protein [Fimbriimonas sp.]
MSTVAFAATLIAPKAFADVLPICGGGGTTQTTTETFTKSFAQQNCSLLMWGYVYERQVVKKTFNNGVTYFCTNWQFNGSCGFGGSSGQLPACPSSTCTQFLGGG